MAEKRESLKSDEGYNSDKDASDKLKIRAEIEKNLNRIEADAIIFKKKYFVQKLIHNSANGVIYKGSMSHNNSMSHNYDSGYRVNDKTPVCIKQVPRERISSFKKIQEKSDSKIIPSEFYYHINATKIDNVVRIFDWFERKSR